MTPTNDPLEGAKKLLNELNKHVQELDTLHDAQPPANDLDGCDEWLRNLQSLYPTVKRWEAQAEAILLMLQAHTLNTISDDDYKKIKNSSTLVENYVRGKYNNTYVLWQSLKGHREAISLACENYRTLMSSYRLERQMSGVTISQNK